MCLFRYFSDKPDNNSGNSTKLKLLNCDKSKTVATLYRENEDTVLFEYVGKDGWFVECKGRDFLNRREIMQQPLVSYKVLRNTELM